METTVGIVLYRGLIYIFGFILGLYRVYIGVMERNMQTTIIYWGYIGIMEKKMEATI